MVLGRTYGHNSLIRQVFGRKAKLESKFTLLETQNEVGSEKKERKKKEKRKTKERKEIMLHFLEYRHQQHLRTRNERKNITSEFLEEIGISKAEQGTAKISRFVE